MSMDFHQIWKCIDIVEICSGIANRRTLSFVLTELCPQHDNGRVLLFHVFIVTSNVPQVSTINSEI